mmetsp:Transcript_117292/g.373647  ORF Transcript_117292/g.373647 Transcript_117292/m.373647 type:complete len:644 (+) Transcript_117292:101-2032(+)
MASAAAAPAVHEERATIATDTAALDDARRVAATPNGAREPPSPMLPATACPPTRADGQKRLEEEVPPDVPRTASNELGRTSSADFSDAESSPERKYRRNRRFDSRSLLAEREGAEISKRYEIDERPLAVGGYGQVFIAKDLLGRDRTVAIKKLMRHDGERDEALKSEVKIMKDLDHPSICKLFETYTQDRVMYFVIEHLEGGDLCDRIMEFRCFDEFSAAYIIRQASGALRYAHAMGIAHRDMKPENVCFCSKNPECKRIKVIDWGLGKHFSRTRMKSSVGSGAFTAPEVLDPPSEDAGYSAACDLWSLGILTYVTLSGKAPFWGGPLQMLGKMREEIYPMTGELWDGISKDGKDFVRSLLKANPEERLPCERLISHPWLARDFIDVHPDDFVQVLSNVEHFSHAPHFLSICVASVAKQLDHRSLDKVYRVFSRLDTNGDGGLQIDEVRAGFLEVFGGSADNTEEVDEMFARLDLDGTGRITYTEFCAAGIGERSYTQEHVLWAAFKTFDIHDNGKITRESLQQVLLDADVTETWSKDVCEDVAKKVVEDFGGEDGQIGFEDWLGLMVQCASQHSMETPKKLRSSTFDDLWVNGSRSCSSAAGGGGRSGSRAGGGGSFEARTSLPRCEESPCEGLQVEPAEGR